MKQLSTRFTDELQERIWISLSRIQTNDITIGHLRALRHDIFQSIMVAIGREFEKLDPSDPPSNPGES